MTATEFIKENYTLTNGGEDYICNHSGQLVGAEDIAEEYHQAKLKLLCIADVSGSLRFSKREVDFAYLCGVFNTSGIDGLHNEIQRLKELGKEPHDIIEACRKQ